MQQVAHPLDIVWPKRHMVPETVSVLRRSADVPSALELALRSIHVNQRPIAEYWPQRSGFVLLSWMVFWQVHAGEDARGPGRGCWFTKFPSIHLQEHFPNNHINGRDRHHPKHVT